MLRRSGTRMQGGLALLAALFVLAVAVVGVSQVVESRDSTSNVIFDGELTAAQLGATTVGGTLAGYSRSISSVAADPDIAALFAPLTKKNRREIATLILPALEVGYPEFSSFLVTNARGTVIDAVPKGVARPGADVSTDAFFKGAIRSSNPYVAAAIDEPAAGGEVVAISTRLIHQGATVAVLQGALPLRALRSAFGGTALRGGGELILVDQTGHFLSGPEAGTETSGFETPFIAAALVGRSGTANGPVPGFSGHRIVAYAPIRSLHWGVIVESPESVLTDPVQSTTIRVSIIFGIFVLFAIGTIVLVARLLGQISAQRDRATSVFTSVGEGVAAVDSTGHIVAVNPALERIIGRPAADVVGRRWADTIPISDERGRAIPWDETLVAEALREGRVVASRGFQLHIAPASGIRIPVALTAAPMASDREEPAGAVVVVRDVSGEQEVDRLKSSLISTVSHELRTPLTMIQGFSELLLTRTDIDNERSQAALGQIHTSSQRLGRIIDDLLSVSRIDAGKVIPDLHPLELSHAIDEAVTQVQGHQTQRVVVDVEADLPAVLGDQDMLVRVLTNLLSNAVKYSPEGSPIRVTARRSGSTVEVSVTDRGIGMTEAEAAAVFDKFTRADRPEVRRVGGTGLGLYITQRLVEVQGGSIGVRSQFGRGSTFWFSLTLVDDHADVEHAEGHAEELV